MQFKKFSGSTMGEALAAVKLALGEDAVIVSTRTLQNGLFKRRQIEVTCAIEEAPAPRLFNQGAREAPPPPPAAAKPPPPPPAEPTWPSEPAPAPAPPTAPAAVSERALERALEPIRRELRAVRLHIAEQAPPDADGLAASMQAHFAGLRELIGDMWAQRQSEGAPTTPLLDLLAAADLDPGVAAELVAEVERGHAGRGVVDSRAALQDDLGALRASIAARLTMPAPPLSGPGPHRLALVGPPGVGKTLLFAKLIDLALSHGHKVALIGTDAWRIAAFEELAHFANLFEVPLVLAGDAKSLGRALARHQECDVVLVDTPGLTAAQHDGIDALRELLAPHAMQAVLCLAATCRHAELVGLLAAFSGLAPGALAFTKLDEAQVLGALVTACAHTGLPLHYLTGGQEATSGLVVTDPAELADRIVGMPLETREFAWMTAGDDDVVAGAAGPARAQGGAYAR